MTESLNNRCKLFIENRDVFKKAFPWENSYFYPICAALFVDKGRKADAENLKETRKFLREKVNAFSNFRSASELAVVAMLALETDRDKRFAEAIDVYNGLKKYFWSSEYLPIASIILSGAVGTEQYSEICERMRRIYDLMKKEHPFLTSSEDSVFSAMLALSDKSDEDILRECEGCYDFLKDYFHDRNALQSLSHVLALADDGTRSVSDKCRDTVKLFEMLKKKGCKYGKGYELATLGALAALPCGLDETVRDMISVSDFLKAQKGYGFFGFNREQRLMHAAMIVTNEHLNESQTISGAAIGSTLSMIAAQQAATCAAIAASVAASNAARAGTH